MRESWRVTRSKRASFASPRPFPWGGLLGGPGNGTAAWESLHENGVRHLQEMVLKRGLATTEELPLQPQQLQQQQQQQQLDKGMSQLQLLPLAAPPAKVAKQEPQETAGPVR